MSYVRASLHLLADAYRFGRATHRRTLVLVLVVALVALLVSVVAQVTAPLALYPFA